MSLERVERQAASVTAVCSRTARARGDLLVAADGVRSTVREQLLPGARLRYAGYLARRGLLGERELRLMREIGVMAVDERGERAPS